MEMAWNQILSLIVADVINLIVNKFVPVHGAGTCTPHGQTKWQAHTTENITLRNFVGRR